MTPTPTIPIGPGQLLLALGFVVFAQIMSWIGRLGLGRDLLVGTLRTFAQLLLMGYVLRFIFALNWAWLVLAVFAVMILSAGRIIRGRIKERGVPFMGPLYGTMFLSYLVVTYLVVGVVVGADPWWRAEYFIPLGGMVVGNTMNALALGLDRLLSELRSRRDEVEMRLCLGADYREASQDILRAAMGAAMIPSINSMMGVGLVFLPGMMTGQILAGADPGEAVRYQIVVMLMLVGASALAALLLLSLVRRRAFGPGQALALGPAPTPDVRD